MKVVWESPRNASMISDSGSQWDWATIRMAAEPTTRAIRASFPFFMTKPRGAMSKVAVTPPTPWAAIRYPPTLASECSTSLV